MPDFVIVLPAAQAQKMSIICGMPTLKWYVPVELRLRTLVARPPGSCSSSSRYKESVADPPPGSNFDRGERRPSRNMRCL